MTATLLQSELSSLIQDSKKKFPEIRAAAEKSLGDLKALPVTSETQLAGDLLRRPNFIEPFILACKSRNVKLAGSGIICLQRLTASRAIPRERLTDLLGALRDVATSSMDIQLKILQTLPSLLQLYEGDLKDALLAVTLEVCGALQSSKPAIISGTAAATFQQLTATVFERVEDGDRNQRAPETSDQDSGAAADAIRLFRDLCSLANNEPPEFAQIKGMSPGFLLEVIGSILANHETIFASHPETIEICQTKLLPAVTNLLASKIGFALAVRSLRIIYLLISRHLDTMHDECEQAVSTMVKLLDPDHSPAWKRVLCMEVFRAICQEAALLPRMFELFDQKNVKNGAITSLLAAFVRIASEDPSLIGLGRQSTVPSRRGGSSQQEDILIDAAGVGGAIGSVVSADITVTGISMEWSLAKTPYMEQLDKSEPSDVPSTYIYSLVINCLVAIAEGLSKFVMPLSLPSKSQRLQESLGEDNGLLDPSQQETLIEKTRSTSSGHHKYQRLLNPLSLTDHPRIAAVKVCANLINACWPAFLATCSTFLNSALDSTFYHNLVRAFQKMTQVSGVLELSTPRDAFLTSLGKAATPISTYSLTSHATRELVSSTEESAINEKNSVQTPVSATERQSVELSRPSLSIRNLLCMRALLNLGVALGPTLNSDSWYIIIETLLHIEALLTSLPRRPPSSGSQAHVAEVDFGETRTSLGAETIAVGNAAKRMFDSTRNYGDEAFSTVVHALFRLAGPSKAENSRIEALPVVSPGVGSEKREFRTHQATRSFSGLWKSSHQPEPEISFILAKLGDLAKINIHRFISTSSEQVSWGLVVVFLHKTVRSYEMNSQLRIKAATVCNSIVAETFSALNSEEDTGSAAQSEAEILRSKAIALLLAQIEGLEHPVSPQRQDEKTTDDEIHAGTLDALEGILGQNGESLGTAWATVFQLLRCTFRQTSGGPLVKFSDNRALPGDIQAWSPEILQNSFRSLQLIISDFLSLFEFESLGELTDVLLLFGLQTNDLNISLTTSNFFASVASLLHDKFSTVEVRSAFQEPTLSQIVKSDDHENIPGALWMLLVLRLSFLCLDGRQDVRNSALRMTFRILDASGSKLTGATWNSLVPGVFFENLRGYHSRIKSDSVENPKWQSSITQILEGATELIVRNIDTIAKDPTFPQTWNQLLCTVEPLLRQRVLSIWSIVFSTVSRILEALRQNEVSSSSYATSALQLFLDHHPADIFGTSASDEKSPLTGITEANQGAFVQHTDVFTEVFLTLRHSSEDQSTINYIDPERVMKSLRSSIFKCTHPQYTSDLKTLAPEQERVIAILSMLRQLMQNKRGDFTTFLLKFVQAALSRAGESTVPTATAKGGKPAQKPTFVAFSAKCTEILDLMTSSFPDEGDVFSDLSVASSITTLAAIIDSKYSALPQNPDSPLWHAASRTATNLVSAAVRHIIKSSNPVAPAHLTAFFASTNSAATAILNATNLNNLTTPPTASKILSDEDIDISTFTTLHTALVPTLGTVTLPLSIRKTYITTLFHASLAAEPWFFDLPPDLPNTPLQNLSTVRPGTVCAPVFPARRRITYTALDALFDLVAKPDTPTSTATDSPRLLLATTAAPYILLRTAHAFKTFMADQPLRSLTPLPRPLRTELLTLLCKSLELRSDDRAFAPLMATGEGVQNDGKSHLRLLYPMVLRLGHVWARCARLKRGGAWQEGEEGRGIEMGIQEWGRVLAGDWGVLG